MELDLELVEADVKCRIGDAQASNVDHQVVEVDLEQLGQVFPPEEAGCRRVDEVTEVCCRVAVVGHLVKVFGPIT